MLVVVRKTQWLFSNFLWYNRVHTTLENLEFSGRKGYLSRLSGRRPFLRKFQEETMLSGRFFFTSVFVLCHSETLRDWSLSAFYVYLVPPLLYGNLNYSVSMFLGGAPTSICHFLKGQKTVHNDKKFCLSHSISQEPYIIWLWFLVHMCKMMISPVNFFIF